MCGVNSCGFNLFSYVAVSIHRIHFIHELVQSNVWYHMAVCIYIQAILIIHAAEDQHKQVVELHLYLAIYSLPRWKTRGRAAEPASIGEFSFTPRRIRGAAASRVEVGEPTREYLRALA